MYNLWAGDLNRNQLNFIKQLVIEFTEDVEKMFKETEYTMNLHLLIHLVDCFLKFGPLKEFNCFFYEHLNGIIIKYVHSPNAINTQLMNHYIEKFNLDMQKERVTNDDKEEPFGKFKVNDQIRYKKIKIKKKIYTSTETEKRNRCKDYFVKMTDDKYCVINRIFERDNDCFLSCSSIHSTPFSFKYNQHNLKLNYLFEVQIKNDSIVYNKSEIKKQMTFMSKFDEYSSKISFPRIGFLIDTQIIHHN